LRSKYVSYSAGYVEAALVFSEAIGHDEVAGMIKAKYSGSEILGAGFVNVFTRGDFEVVAECYGKSASLNMESRLEDDLLVKYALGLG